MKYIPLPVFIILVIASCNNSLKEEGAINLPFKTGSDSYIIDSLIDSITYIKLEATTNSYFSKIDKLMIKNDTVFIIDIHGHNSILAFNINSGAFIYKVGQQGHGPGEYIRFRNFTINDHHIYAIDNDRQMLMTFSMKDGSYISSKRLPIIPIDLAVTEDLNYLFATAPVMSGATLAMQHNDYRIVITDSMLNITKQILPYEQNECKELSRASFFTQNRNEIIYNAQLSDNVILLNVNSINNQLEYNFNFPNNVPVSERNNIETLYNFQFLSSTPFKLGNYFIGEINDPTQDGVFIYDIERKITYTNNLDANMSKHLLPPACVGLNAIISICDDYEILYLGLVKYGFPRAPDSLEKAMQDGNHVLVRYTLKDIVDL